MLSDWFLPLPCWSSGDRQVFVKKIKINNTSDTTFCITLYWIQRTLYWCKIILWRSWRNLWMYWKLQLYWKHQSINSWNCQGKWFIGSVCVCVYVGVGVCVHLSVCLSCLQSWDNRYGKLDLKQSINQSICLVCLCLSLSASVCLSVCLSVWYTVLLLYAPCSPVKDNNKNEDTQYYIILSPWMCIIFMSCDWIHVMFVSVGKFLWLPKSVHSFWIHDVVQGKNCLQNWKVFVH